jgi:16S rRNA processing protein RimM
MQKHFQIGVVAGAHGINGEIRVAPSTNDPARFNLLNSVYISEHAVSSHLFNEAEIVKIKVLDSRICGNTVFLMLEKTETREDAERIRGRFLLVERKDAVKLEEDEYFIADVIGCCVYDNSRGYIGELKDVISTGSNDVYVLNGSKYGEILVPAIRDVVIKIDIDMRRIDVELLKGLIDD